MAKETINKTYTKGTVYVADNGDICLDEVKKDDVKTYNLTKFINSLVGCVNVNITVSANGEIMPDNVE